MRITKARAAENRDKVLSAAAELFRERGFDGVGIADVMRAAGLTHGGFYNHFESKDALESAACAHVFDAAVNRVERVAKAEHRDVAVADYVRAYLSDRARDARGARCPMVAFATDVSRQEPQVRDAYAEGLSRYLEALARALPSQRAPDTPDRGAAVDMLVRLVGALSLARSVAKADPDLSAEILERTRAALLAGE